MNLSPLHDALDHLEQAAAGIAEKLAGAVTHQVDNISQDEVDQLVSRVEGIAERLTGLQAPATATAAAAAADTTSAAGPAPSTSVPEWTPEHPAG